LPEEWCSAGERVYYQILRREEMGRHLPRSSSGRQRHAPRPTAV